MKINLKFASCGLALAILAAAPLSARADEMRGDRHEGGMRGGERHAEVMRGEWRGGGWQGPRGAWHDDFRHFDQHDNRVWRRGGWRQSWHDGRYGWWWLAGGDWFFYSQPVYPYPDPYAYVPRQTIVVQPSPQTIEPQPVQQMWYFCAAANRYYPYVASCPGGWETVPARPTPAPATSPDTELPGVPPAPQVR